MIKNQKGFTGAELALAGLIGFFIVSIVLPLIKPLIPGMSGGTEKTTQTESYKETIEPYTMDGKVVPPQTLPNGDEVLLFKRTKSNNTLNEQTKPPAPLIERIVLWFVRLGILGLALALAFPTLAVTVWIWIKKKWGALQSQIEAHKADLTSLKTDTKKIVLSVDNGFKAFDTRIAAAVAAFESAKTVAASTLDPNALAANKAIMDTQQAVANALTATKQAVLDGMTAVQGQNSPTEALVAKAQQGTL